MLAENSKPFEKKARKEKKKKYCQEHKKNLGTSTTNVNTDDVTFSKAPKDTSLVTYFNCDKTGHYARNCLKSKRESSKTSKN